MRRSDSSVPRPAAAPGAGGGAATERRFEALFEQAPFSAQLLAPDGRTLRVNRAWERLWRVEGPQAETARHYVLTEYNVFTDPQLEAKGVVPYLRRAFAGEPVTMPPIVYDPAEIGQLGEPRWVRAHFHPIKDEHGHVFEVMLIHEDVTEQRRAEGDLRVAEERLRLATDAGNIGIWEWDLENARVSWSDRVYALHGLRPGEFDGRVESFTQLVHPDDLGRLWPRVEAAVQEHGAFSAEFRARLPDGSHRWLSTWARVHRTTTGSARRMIGATISVDDYKRAESALKESDRRKDDFLAMLAHELRNPLAPISNAAQLLRTPHAQDPEVVRQSSEIVARQVRHLSALVDDLLDVSRVTRGLIQLELETVDVNAVVAAAVEQIRPLIEGREHVLATWTDPGNPRVRGDRTRLVQVVANLLNNAAKYTPRGGRLDVRTEVAGEQVAISVSDNGIGMPPELLPHVFELFTQGERKPDRAQGGLGIGLALVRSLVHLHGGRVSASSAGPGQGSTFRISLPRLAGVDVAVPDPGPPIAAPSGASRIMVVDDNVDAGTSLRALLQASGFRVAVHTGGESALAEAAREMPDVFILDIGLPGMDGYELARRLRALPRSERATFVALTGYGQPHDRARSREAGFDYHFVKPVDVSDLHPVLTRGH